MIASPCDDHHTHRMIVGNFFPELRQPHQHFWRHGIAFFRPVEGDDGNAIALLDKKVGHSVLVLFVGL